MRRGVRKDDQTRWGAGRAEISETDRQRRSCPGGRSWERLGGPQLSREEKPQPSLDSEVQSLAEVVTEEDAKI